MITIPSVQLLELFERSEYQLETMVMNKLKGICHTRCLAVLTVLDRPSEIPLPGTVTHPVEEIDWLSDNQIKEFQKFRPVRFTLRMIIPKNIGILRMRREFPILFRLPRIT